MVTAVPSPFTEEGGSGDDVVDDGDGDEEDDEYGGDVVVVADVVDAANVSTASSKYATTPDVPAILLLRPQWRPLLVEVVRVRLLDERTERWCDLARLGAD